jgi:hypothetical protein
MQQQPRLGLIRRDACRIDPSHDFIVSLLIRKIDREVTQTDCI